MIQCLITAGIFALADFHGNEIAAILFLVGALILSFVPREGFWDGLCNFNESNIHSQGGQRKY